MKPIHFIPPVLSLAIAGVWLGTQQRSISRLEEESVTLRKHIAAVRETVAAADSTKAAEKKKKEAIDWRQTAKSVASMNNGGMGDMKSMIRLQKLIQEMDRDALIAALDEIAALNLQPAERALLENFLMGPLIEMDPELALTRFAEKAQEEHGGMAWQLSRAMKGWADKDPVKAAAWLDRMIDEGKFDSKKLSGNNPALERFESNLITALFPKDPAAAANRLRALPDEQRADVLRNVSDIRDEDQAAFANLVRQETDAEQSTKILAGQVSRNAWKEGYGDLTKQLDLMQATPQERAAAVSDVVDPKISFLSQKRKVTAEDIDALRTWAAAQSPETVDKTTGAAIRRSMEVNKKLDFSEAAEMAERYHQSSGNEVVLIEFFDGPVPDANKEQARAMVEKISDKEARQQILNRLK